MRVSQYSYIPHSPIAESNQAHNDTPVNEELERCEQSKLLVKSMWSHKTSAKEREYDEHSEDETR